MMCAEIYSLKSISYNYIVSFSDVARDLLNISVVKRFIEEFFMNLLSDITKDRMEGGGARTCPSGRGNGFLCLTYSTLGCDDTVFTRGGIRNVSF